ncbi:MAG TPA: iron uptake transporter permease EfeU [Lacisediminihabitans sp.]|uniref:iron uptake transporter permease EfeU n=1 Tax=Lacisediminihabitans sp. TaxID=2787631 RepID=UPI002EDAC7FA
MLATLVIGLREGLEAALIVGILAAFLRRNGRSLRAMWIGVITAVLLSIGVGAVLEAVSLALPQAQQEGLETIIGAVAVAFVTGMIVWMNTHASGLKREIESSATAALGEGTAGALAVMAFLAVLKEGFETSVFLLATFQSSTSVAAAIGGAALGILIAVGIGIGIYHGGVRINLGRFFRITGVFLVFVAAGLVLTALRTAHEAGWLNVGQQRTVDLSWLAPNGSIQSALVTGVLGIPADPRVIEALGWGSYLVIVLTIVFWPASHRPSAATVPRLKWAIAGGLVVIAAVLGLAVPTGADVSGVRRMPIADAAGRTIGAVAVLDPQAAPRRFAVEADGTTTDAVASRTLQATVDGIAAIEHRLPPATTTGRSTVTLDDLVALNGGSLPIGMSLQQSPGPFQVTTTTRSTATVWTVGDGILDATSTSSAILTIAGGGLDTPRTVSLPANGWAASQATVTTVTDRALAAQSESQERLLWKLYLPIALAIAALALAISALRGGLRRSRIGDPEAWAVRASHTADPTRPAPLSRTAHETRNDSYVPR